MRGGGSGELRVGEERVLGWPVGELGEGEGGGFDGVGYGVGGGEVVRGEAGGDVV